MLYQNRSLNAVNWLFFLSVVGLNIFGLMVTSQLGSVFRAVLLTSRTASVLLLLFLHVLVLNPASILSVDLLPPRSFSLPIA